MDSNLNPLEYQDDLDETFNPLDLFCTSIDTLRGTEIDQTIPANSGWASRPTPLKLSSGIATAEHHTTGTGGSNSPPPGRLASIMSNITTTTTNNDYEQEQIIQTLCRQGIPPSLRRSAWIMNVVHASNPNMNKSDVNDYGTFRKVRVIGKKGRVG